MASFNTLFPDPMDCYFALFQDAVYEHDKTRQYTFKNGEFIRRNRVDVVNKIKDMSNLVYDSFVTNDPSFNKGHPLIDYPALLSVLTRYSRDIYGFRRIVAKIHDLSGKIDKDQQKHLEQIVIDGADFGFKIPSENPYIDRQAAVLLYWFSVLKPFHLEYNESGGPSPEPYVQAYFNEYFSYFLVCLALYPQSITLEIHNNKAQFEEFLNQLHFRNLSRSSLEFFLPYNKKSG
ncbi:MAG: hypothetical protein LBB78_09745 [Spirochaetaceae bacterium]|jgi:hypothetical protein|nr:hypothetical protein [Spirochaetaceae bacterium]